MMFCSLLLLGVKLLSIPSARLRKEIVKQIRDKHEKEKARENSRKMKPRSSARNPQV